MAKSSGEMPARSIHTAARASPIAIATAVLAVGARFSGQTSRSTEPSSTTSQPVARLDARRPTRAIRAVPRRRRWGRIASNSSVSPLFESSRATSSAATMPRSPCRASTGLRNTAVRPIEEKVAAILRATMPLLPTPVSTSLARRWRHPSSSSRAASTWLLLRRWAAAAMAAASSSRQRVRADKTLVSQIPHSRWRFGGSSFRCAPGRSQRLRQSLPAADR